MESQCSICFEVIATRVQCACVPCGHTFCLPCITEWSHTSKTCPQCRLPVQSILRLFTDTGNTGGRTAQNVTRSRASETRAPGHRNRRGYSQDVRPVRTPANRNAPSILSANWNDPSISPTNQNAPSISPTNRNAPSISPTNWNAPSISPTNRNAPSISPTSRNAPSISPTNRNAPSVSPTNRNAPSVSPANRVYFLITVGIYMCSIAAVIVRCLKAVCRFTWHHCRAIIRKWSTQERQTQLFFTVLASFLSLFLVLDYHQPNGFLHGILAPKLQPVFPVVNFLYRVIAVFFRAVLSMVMFAVECVRRIGGILF